MKLYGYWRSSSSWRVRAALYLKNIQFEYVPVNLVKGEQADLKDKNARTEVPILEFDHGGKTHILAQSMAIIELLEDFHPRPALMPQDPLRRARARMLAEMVNSGIQPLQNSSVLNHVRDACKADEKAWAAHFIARGLVALEAEAREAGTFFGGDAPGLADVYLVPQMYSARRFGVDLAPYPTLLRVEAACAALEAFKKAHADNQPDTPREEAPQ